MDFIFRQEKIKKAAQQALKKNAHIVDPIAQEAFIAGFEQAAEYTEKKVACRMEYENMSGSIPEITNYTQEAVWRLYATGKDWDFLYEDNQEFYDGNAMDCKERIAEKILFMHPHYPNVGVLTNVGTIDDLMKLSLEELENMKSKLKPVRL